MKWYSALLPVLLLPTALLGDSAPNVHAQAPLSYVRQLGSEKYNRILILGGIR